MKIKICGIDHEVVLEPGENIWNKSMVYSEKECIIKINNALPTENREEALMIAVIDLILIHNGVEKLEGITIRGLANALRQSFEPRLEEETKETTSFEECVRFYNQRKQEENEG